MSCSAASDDGTNQSGVEGDDGGGNSDSDDDFIAIVIDNGSMMCKGGFSGDKTCRAVVRSIIGRPVSTQTESVKEVPSSGDCYVGDEALTALNSLTLSYPMERGCVENWEGMEEIWKVVFRRELRTQPEQNPLLITEAPHNPPSHREKMAEVLFESLNIPGCFVVYPGVLALYASGRTTGIVIDSGDTVTSVIPIFEGEILHDAIRRVDLGGRNLTVYLQNLLQEKGCIFSQSDGLETVRKLKEKHSFVVQDYDKELRENSFQDQTVNLQNGSSVALGKERFMCPEAFFKPSLMGLSCQGVAELAHDAITSCEAGFRESLYQNVILSGANFMLAGVKERLSQDLSCLAPANSVVKVISPPERNKSAWLGGSILSSLSFFPKMVVGRETYEEVGPSVLHRCKLSSMLSRVT